MSGRQNVTGDGLHPAPELALFHRVLDADQLAVQQALIDIRGRFGGKVAEDALARTELVLAEVLNNIVQHGILPPSAEKGSPTVTIHLTVTGNAGELACAVADNGVPLPLACLSPSGVFPAPEVAALRAGGFGWLMIRGLTRSLFYCRECGRNMLCFTIPPRDSAWKPSRADVA